MAASNTIENELRQRPLGDVARDLTGDLSLLVRQEIRLAKAELAQKGQAATTGLAMLAGAFVVALCAAGVLSGSLVLVFSLFLPSWAAALLIAAALAGGAFLLARQGKELVARAGKPVPEQTIETVKEDLEWAKTRASSARR